VRQADRRAAPIAYRHAREVAARRGQRVVAEVPVHDAQSRPPLEKHAFAVFVALQHRRRVVRQFRLEDERLQIG
jgi:hypothetical protein